MLTYTDELHDRIVATLQLLRHYRAFLASPYRQMRDPYEVETWRDGASRLTHTTAQRRLARLVHMAISRKGGGCLPINDARSGASLNHRGRPRRKEAADYLRALGIDAQALNTPRRRIYQIMTPELRRRFAARIVRTEED